MRSFVIVLLPPCFQKLLCLLAVYKGVTVQTFRTQLAIEALNKRVFQLHPWIVAAFLVDKHNSLGSWTKVKSRLLPLFGRNYLQATDFRTTQAYGV